MTLTKYSTVPTKKKKMFFSIKICTLTQTHGLALAHTLTKSHSYEINLKNKLFHSVFEIHLFLIRIIRE